MRPDRIAWLLVALAARHVCAGGPAAPYRPVVIEHVKRGVEKLRGRGQAMRTDGLPALTDGNGLCLPCHTHTPGTPRSLSPVHQAISKGMVVGLTQDAARPARAPQCVDCHVYPVAHAEIRAGDLRVDLSRKSCNQSGCHAERTYEWALTSLGRMRQSVKAAADHGLFVGSARYETLGVHVNGLVDRSDLKTASVVAPWLLIAVALAAGCWAAARRSGRPAGPDEPCADLGEEQEDG